MAVDSRASLVLTLRECELLSPVQLEQLTGLMQDRFTDGRALVRALVQQGWLTAYQANELVLGRGQRLVLGPYRLL
jgi:hypothetical protein